MLLSDNWGPYYSIQQCLDRVERMRTDSLRKFPHYELENTNILIPEDQNCLDRFQKIYSAIMTTLKLRKILVLLTIKITL